MSTKTTFKRIALVAVAALGFGMLSAVPSNAAVAASITIGTVPNARPGQTVAVPVTVYLPAGLTTSDTITVNIEATSAPLQGGASNAQSKFNPEADNGAREDANDAGALLSLDDAATGTTPSSTPTITGGTGVAGRLVLSSGARTSALATTGEGYVAATSGEYTLTSSDLALGRKTLYALVTPDVIGSYAFLVSTSAPATAVSGYTAGDINASFSLTAGQNTVTAVALTPLAGTDILAYSPNGVPVLVSLVGGTLAGVEGINLSASGNGVISLGTTSPSGGFAATQALTAARFAGGTSAIVWLSTDDSVEETVVLTATSAAMGSTLTASRSFSVIEAAGSTTDNISIDTPGAGATTAPTYAANNIVVTAGTPTIYTVSTSSTSQKIGLTTTAETAAVDYEGYVTVTDSRGLLTGVATLVYDMPFSAAFGKTASGLSLSFAANMAAVPADTNAYTVAIPAGDAATAGETVGLSSAVTIAFRAAAPTASTISVTPATTILAAPGAAIPLTAKVKDQFGGTLLNAAISVRTTGRNNPADTAANTGSTGSYTFTTADGSTSTTSLTDTVTFSSGSATPKAVTISYRATAVDAVTVTGGNTTASVTAATVAPNDIAAGDGVEAGAITVTATVKDALGNALAGVPVSFTVAGTGVAFKSTSATVYTGSTGTAAGSLYGWIAGTYTYTVTAGGKTTTGTATFAQSTAEEARVISATVEGNVVTGKAVDRLGNPVSGVTLYASTTAPANIGGSFVANAQTGADGTAKWVVTNSGSVTVSAVNPTSVAGTTFGQTCALAGNLTCAVPGTDAEAFTASTVGTATTAETYVGASFAPAGVASASVEASDVTASSAADAAAEATDAANAATDAANAAAEAADAATAAAQDAADAVAALATQVATYISNLRKQITALTNLVIKIQKKVNA